MRNSKLIATTACIKENYNIIGAITTTIETRLKISHSQEYVDAIMDQIKLTQEHCVELGIDCARNGLDQKIKENVWTMRRMRGNEL